MDSDDVRLIYFCDGPWAGRQEYIKAGCTYFFVAVSNHTPKFCGEIDVNRERLKKYTYKIDGNYAILEEE
jgi:hypothetical protein